MRMFVDAGLQVSFWPDNLYRDRAYIKALQEIGVEVLYGPQLVGQFPEWIKESGRYYDYAFLSRAHVAKNYIDCIREHSSAKILYYGHDLPYERLANEYKLTGKAAAKQEMEYWLGAEKEIWQNSDVIYYPAQDEVDTVRRAVPDKAVRTFSIYVYPDREIEEAPARFGGERVGPPTAMFVAGFRHRPNIDAAVWFVREILPLVRIRIPQIRAILAGSFPPPAVTGLAGEHVLVTGYISDSVLEWFYRSATIAILPLRFPGAQGLPQPSKYVSIGDTPQLFADRVVEVIESPRLAQKRALRGLDYVQREFGYGAVAARMAIDIPELGSLRRGQGRLTRAEKEKTPPNVKRPARGRREPTHEGKG